MGQQGEQHTTAFRAPVRCDGRLGAVERIRVEAEDGAAGSAARASEGEGRRKRPRKRFSWDNFTYTTRVTAAFAFVAIMTALVAIGVLSFVWGAAFPNLHRIEHGIVGRIDGPAPSRPCTLARRRNPAPARCAAKRCFRIGQYAAGLSEGVAVDHRRQPHRRPAGTVVWSSSEISIDNGMDGGGWRRVRVAHAHASGRRQQSVRLGRGQGGTAWPWGRCACGCTAPRR